jgi:hypothetical protein
MFVVVVAVRGVPALLVHEVHVVTMGHVSCPQPSAWVCWCVSATAWIPSTVPSS